MDYEKLTAYCGIDCFNCELFEDNITKEMQQRMAKLLDKKEEDIICQGCKVSGCIITPYDCPTKECAVERNLQFCSDCDDFPCDKLHPTADQASSLPHNMKMYNLCRIKSIGIEEWAKEAGSVREKYFKGIMRIGIGPTLE